MSYKDDEILLEENGWDVECQSPFEIRNRESGSFATGEAAYLVVNSLRPKSCDPKDLIYNLDPDDKFYVEKLDILHKLVHTPNVGHIISKDIVNWCKSVGLCAEASHEDHTSWWTCRVKDDDDEVLDSLENELTYNQCLKMADHLYDWMVAQRYSEEALLHAAVCCDHVGMVHFKAALAHQINEFFNKE